MQMEKVHPNLEFLRFQVLALVIKTSRCYYSFLAVRGGFWLSWTQKYHFDVRELERSAMPKIADFPYTNAQVLDLAKQFPTPFHLYHEETIRNTVRGLNKAFSWCPGYKNHFAVKATPNPHIMQILKEEGRVDVYYCTT